MSGEERTEVVRKGFTRGQFVGMGLSAAVLSAAASPYVAKARTVNFGAATTGRLSRYCRGDGSDETAQINKCFTQHLFVEVDEPPAGIGYGFSITGEDGGIVLRSGQEVNGRGANAKLLRVGKWEENGRGLRNRDAYGGDSDIKLNNLYMDGFRSRPDVPDYVGSAASTGILIRAKDPDETCRNIQLTGVQVHNWPGSAIRVINGYNVDFVDTKMINPSRCGVAIRTSRHVKLLRVTALETGDDAIAFYTTGEVRNMPVIDVIVDGCEARTRQKPEWGAALKLAGVNDALVTKSTFTHAKNALVSIVSYPSFIPKNIRVINCRLTGGDQHSLEIKAKDANGIFIRDNYMRGPAGDCVNVSTWTGNSAYFGVTIAGNTLVNPGSNRYINVQSNVKGVKTFNNRMIHRYTTPPTLKLNTPNPGGSVRGPVKRLELVAKASVSKAKNDLRKDNVKLSINGRNVSFEYNRSGGAVVKTKPRLRKGKNFVRLKATFMGATTQKTWSFKVR